tara:strand:- start:3 stop:239 length:237 start_codon:yes stop_codon:yes gene_type:complete
MPIYEYKCESCGSISEYFQKSTDDDIETCKICNTSGKMKRLISSSGFRLKGSGWYETDFKKNINNDEKKADIKSNKNI